MAERVLLTYDDGVAEVRLNRPEKRNALDRAMFEALIAAGESLARDASLRAVVLSGEGPCFCSGLDFPSFLPEITGGTAGLEHLFAREQRSPANFAQRAAWVWRELPVPVIAAIQGAAFGGGFQIALAADLRLVTSDVQLALKEIEWGIVPDMSATQTLRRLVRFDVALELALTGRVLSGEEAARLGLATRVCQDPRSAALALAKEIAGKSPDAVRVAKRLFDAAWDAEIADGLQLEESLQRGLFGGANQREALSAKFERRAPRFRDT